MGRQVLDIKIGDRYGNIRVIQATDSPYPHLYLKDRWYICKCEVCQKEFTVKANRVINNNHRCRTTERDIRIEGLST